MPSTNELLLRVLKDQADMRAAMRRVVGNLPLYDIDNENSPVVLATNQNNYVPGNFDVLRLASASVVNITGIAAGVKGRKLRLFNVGSFAITLVHQSGSSLAANRFAFVNSSDFIIPPSGNVLLYYDATTSRWIGGDQASIYDVVNETTPAQITANENNYDPGLAEVLRLSTDAARTITGISGGVKGRYLQVINVGNFNITLSYESGSSLAGNRFITPSGENTVLFPRASVRLYYDGVLLRWSIPDAPTWMGTYGKTVILTSGSSQSIPDNSDTKFTNFTAAAVSDQWGMWDSGNQRIVIPETGVYMGVVGFQFPGNVGALGGVRGVKWVRNGALSGICPVQVGPAAQPVATDIAAPLFYPLSVGDTLEVYVLQDCGVNMSVDFQQFALARIT